MVTRADVIAEARRWLGVRWAHQGRGRDGVDCVGLLIVVARGLHLLSDARLAQIEHETCGYSRYPRGPELRLWCRRELAEIAPETAGPADVLLFRIDEDPQHLGLLGEHATAGQTLIHAYALGPRRVIETRFDALWRGRVAAAFALPGVG